MHLEFYIIAIVAIIFVLHYKDKSMAKQARERDSDNLLDATKQPYHNKELSEVSKRRLRQTAKWLDVNNPRATLPLGFNTWQPPIDLPQQTVPKNVNPINRFEYERLKKRALLQSEKLTGQRPTVKIADVYKDYRVQTDKYKQRESGISKYENQLSFQVKNQKKNL